MWDKPSVLNRLADALLVLALIGMLSAGVVWVVRLPVFPVSDVRVVTPLAHVTRQQVEDIVQRYVRGTFFTLQLDAARAGFETLPWVRRAEVRRQWPGRIEVALIEHVPLARWGKTALVSSHGEVFEAAYDGVLPVFNGPAGVAKEMVIQYHHFRRDLAAIGKAPSEVNLSLRRAWQIRLDDGMTLDLGREQIEERLRRFVASYAQSIARMPRPVDRVDLRYANGFAARVPGLQSTITENRRKRGT